MRQHTDARQTPTLELPPYGHMHDDFKRQVLLDPLPDHFKVGGRTAEQADYDAFIADHASAMSDVLWPRYDFSTRSWVGKAADHALDLTLADLTLIGKLRQRLDDEVVVPEVRRDGVIACREQRLAKNQRAVFRLEDTSARGTVDLYLPSVLAADPALLDKVKASVAEGFQRLGNTSLRLKQEFQRPRPYQVAFLLGQDYQYEFAASAVTPAMVSGHAMQGLFVRTYATLQHRRALSHFLGAVEAMQSYCIEIGDRRVFAGVHYPTDNLASWYVCLRLCEHSFDRYAQEARTFMWQAIQASAVYKEMLRASKDEHVIYAPLLALLQQEAERPLREISTPSAVPVPAPA